LIFEFDQVFEIKTEARDRSSDLLLGNDLVEVESLTDFTNW